MSIVVCENCDFYIDIDFDCECFVEISIKKEEGINYIFEKILCGRCREDEDCWFE